MVSVGSIHAASRRVGLLSSLCDGGYADALYASVADQEWRLVDSGRFATSRFATSDTSEHFVLPMAKVGLCSQSRERGAIMPWTRCAVGGRATLWTNPRGAKDVWSASRTSRQQATEIPIALRASPNPVR